MKKSGMRMLLGMMILVMVMLCGPSPVSAAKKTLVNQGWTQKLKQANKKARSVKCGTYTIKLPSKGRGYLKFRAPKTKTYTFTISKLKAKKKGKRSNGYFYVMTKYGVSGTKIGQDMLKTQGGTTNTLWLGTKRRQIGKKYNWELKTRYGKIALEAGETVYLYFNFSPKDTLRLNIK